MEGGLCASALSSQWKQGSSEVACSERHVLRGGLRGEGTPQPSPLGFPSLLKLATFLPSLAPPKEVPTVQTLLGAPLDPVQCLYPTL